MNELNELYEQPVWPQLDEIDVNALQDMLQEIRVRSTRLREACDTVNLEGMNPPRQEPSR